MSGIVHPSAAGRVCKKCGVFKPFAEMVKSPTCKDGYRPLCADCMNVFQREYWCQRPGEKYACNLKSRINNGMDKYNAYQREWRKRSEKRKLYNTIYSRIEYVLDAAFSSPVYRKNGFAIVRSYEEFRGVMRDRYRAVRLDMPIGKGETLIARIQKSEYAHGFFAYTPGLKLDATGELTFRIIHTRVKNLNKKGALKT